MHIVAQLICSVLILTLWILANSTTTAIAFCVLFGMFSGTVIGLPPASIANILGCTYNTPSTKIIAHSKLGQWTGMMYSAAAIPSLAGPVIVGHLITKYNTYITVQAWSGACLFASALCMIVARIYLPCADGQSVGEKIANWRQGKQQRKLDLSDTDVESITVPADFSKSFSRDQNTASVQNRG